ncbi:hypothetical protein N7532_011003 [Penicillium argentinense]|uniref:DSBA-like thioredoxin domain-containing protein n=1 Tax=Penicillium argentinense TaxID=1131581 RepID=A0A9W9JUH3_9EURO|nr:uncharacterized protein N7532_011003 [Penicillium argentinense]KAJ5081960.1 hypothetical protein N7532_011003 [Penicillium argentinense]
MESFQLASNKLSKQNQWCYIGKRNVEKAISLHQNVTPGGHSDIFSIKWRTYYLDYNPHGHSVLKSELVREKLAGMTSEQREELSANMKSIGRTFGISFMHGDNMGDTRNAHRLVYLAQGQASGPGGITSEIVVEKIFEAYHERGLDISDNGVLQMVAVEVVFDRIQVGGWPGSSLGADEVDEEAKVIKSELKSGVPVFSIQLRFRVDGLGILPSFRTYLHQ